MQVRRDSVNVFKRGTLRNLSVVKKDGAICSFFLKAGLFVDNNIVLEHPS